MTKKEVEAVVSNHAGWIEHLAFRMDELAVQVKRTEAAIERTQVQIEETNRAVKELAESGKDTDLRLKELGVVTDRRITDLVPPSANSLRIGTEVKISILLDNYMLNHGEHICSVRRTRSSVKYLNEAFGPLDHTRLTPAALRGYRLAEKLSPASFNRDLGVLRAAFATSPSRTARSARRRRSATARGGEADHLAGAPGN